MPRVPRVATILAAAVLGAASCRRAPEPDAYGNVEATDVVVSAEVSGRLVAFLVTEGAVLAAGAEAGAIDPTDLDLERDHLDAQRRVSASRVNEVAEQADVLAAQRAAATADRDAARAQRAGLAAQQQIAARTHDRTARLFAQQAATAQQLDQTERDARALADQIAAQDEQIIARERQIDALTRQIAGVRAQQQTATRQVDAVDAQIAQVGSRIRKTRVANPVAGTVLATYAERGELVQPGQPLYRIANLDAVDVRAYVSEVELARIKVGQQVDVTFDAGGSRQTVQGTLQWIAAQAEFTPTPIQTRDERATLVYAVKIRTPNEQGLLKIGMPVDVRFARTGGDGR
jgi:HlyD family secretion protein